MESAVGWLAIFWGIVVYRLTFAEYRYTPTLGVLGFLSVLTPNSISLWIQFKPTSLFGRGLVFLGFYIGLVSTYYWARRVFCAPPVKILGSPSNPDAPRDRPLISAEKLREIQAASRRKHEKGNSNEE